MSASARWAGVIGAALASVIGGCAVDSTGSTSFGSGSGGGTYGGSSGGAASPEPMLVDVDPNLTLTAKPGEGVAVFTEYAMGGHWHVWWTCDTNQSGFGCHFDVTISVVNGGISNAIGQGLESHDQVSQTTPGQIEVTTLTTTGTDGVTFDAQPGTIVTVDAKMDGVENGAMMFFVQGGLVNGNFPGTVTDPLMFEPSSP